MLPDGLVWDEMAKRTMFVWAAQMMADGNVRFFWIAINSDWSSALACSDGNTTADLASLRRLPTSLYTYGCGPYSPQVRAVLEDTRGMSSAREVATYLSGYHKLRTVRLVKAMCSIGLDQLSWWPWTENDTVYWLVTRAIQLTRPWLVPRTTSP